MDVLDVMGYNLEPKQAWRLAGRLLSSVKYDQGIEQKNEWVYASQESDRYKKQFESWIKAKDIKEDEEVWILTAFKPNESQLMKWSEFLRNWAKLLADDDITVTNKDFTWVLEYKSQKVARFGRKME
jgi:hypothetical protein